MVMVPLGRMNRWKARISNFGWWCFLLFIPTQLGRHFWTDWSYAGGIRSDYLVPIVYFSDIWWLIWVVTGWKGKRFKSWLKFDLYKILGIGLVGLNILIAKNKGVAIYEWWRWGQWLITVLILIDTPKLMIKINKVLPIWILAESWLALAQMVNQGSLQGFFYWLGERRLTLSTIGVAQMGWDNGEILRGYGTFSHPNSLAGFLMVSWVWWWGENRNKNRDWKYWLVVWGGIMGVAISGSRTVWVLMAGLIGWWMVGQGKQWRRWIIMLGMVGVALLVWVINTDYQFSRFAGGWDKQGIEKRWKLILVAKKMIEDNPLLGVGAGNFVVRLPEYSNKLGGQPVHNLVLLMLTEIGWLMVALVGLGLSKLVFGRQKKWREWWWGAWLVVIITGMVDHYWLTLPQNRWLLALLVGMVVTRVKLRNV